MQFWKGHALGNDYIVVDGTGRDAPTPDAIRALCDRHRGVGGDGVLVGDLGRDPVGLRIFNPDGGEAEKSGNGLRIFGAWLHARGVVDDAPFPVALPGETVEMAVVSARQGALVLRVEMGTASFRAGDLPFTGVDPDDVVQGRPLALGDETVDVHLVSVGNPHCVVFADPLDDAELRRIGPGIQRHPGFERGVNVQLARVAGPDTLDARIWERGAGETLASGSSACAVAAAAVRAGLVHGPAVRVRMPGGQVQVEVAEDWRIRLTGEARIVYRGETVDGAIDFGSPR